MSKCHVAHQIKLLDGWYKITEDPRRRITGIIRGRDEATKLRLFKWNCRVVKNLRVVSRVDENLLDFSSYYELISKPFYSMTTSTWSNYKRH